MLLSRVRVKSATRQIVPLSIDEVARFWSSFGTSRDLRSWVLMLLQGLRSAEVLAFESGGGIAFRSPDPRAWHGRQTSLSAAGPGNHSTAESLSTLEQSDPCSAALFVSLKGPSRGTRMTAAGLRSLFRHHRHTTGVALANPHRFRHTFASDMVRAGVSLPALMRLMGHADIQTTLLYVQTTPQDVYLKSSTGCAGIFTARNPHSA